MEHAALGPLSVSRVGLGCNNFGGRLDFERTRAVVDAALDAGITFFDTADIYGDRSGTAVYGNLGGSERFLGRLLQGRRERVVLATKFGGDMRDGTEARGAPAYVRRALQGSLERLRTDRADLLYYHWPDGVTPIAETVGAMAELVQEGMARAIGLSNVGVEQLEEAAAAAEISAVQNEYSLLDRRAQADVLPRCMELGISFVPYYPLAAGLLTGKYRYGEAPPEGTRWAGTAAVADDWVTPGVPTERGTFERIRRLDAFARERGRTLLELAVAGLASQPGIASVIAGATRPEQVRANAAAGRWRLSEEERAALSSL